LGLALPRHVPLQSHALSMTAKTAVACNMVEAQVVPVERAAGVRLVTLGPFLHVVSMVGNHCSSCPPTLPRAAPQPSA
jgi:hypothetical protein